ncbi:MAG: signal peptidase I [Omnitrophica bacterium RIFCSPHIGHO2_02_FULL_49_9]|nr:MAG: signal peptidase I [Omnitrophica bacterium RIFCSPHIGHO2_02_FULL_49_9]OGW88599.1 MAG: signal peptidase I [Omnitrophica bacterium RIFCSPLOWO2_01_FULL_50_24]
MWREWGEPLLMAAVIAIAIRTFVVGPYKIPTGSMRPTLIEGDRIFVDKWSYHFRLPKRGEIIVFRYPPDPKKDFVKRLIAFGGEEVVIQGGHVFINGQKFDQLVGVTEHYYYNRKDWEYGREGEVIQVPIDSFFVLGDNSAQSSDSRNWGFVPKRNLVGRAFVIWWPLRRMGVLH